MDGKEYINRWFVLYTKNRQEELVRKELPFNTIVPMMERKKVKTDRAGKKIVTVDFEPKYPNYVFVQHDGSEKFFDVCLRHKQVVSFAATTPIDKSEEKVIFEKELSRNIYEGAVVDVVDGPYKDQQGTVIGFGEEKCLVRISILGIGIDESIPTQFLLSHVEG